MTYLVSGDEQMGYSPMTPKTKIMLSMASLLCLVIGVGTIFIVSQQVFSLPFRAANDALHKQEAPITLDFLIPGGTHIDDKMTIGQVIRIRFEKPKGRMNNFIKEVSKQIPFKYRFLGTLALYLFWTFLFLIFFRIFTWMRYALALTISFFAGSLVYFFMPDLVLGRIDDMGFLGWAIACAGAVWWYARRKKLQYH
jgi:hypothetical protein